MQGRGNKFLTVFLTIIITLVLVAIVGFILVKTNVISFKSDVKDTPSEKTEIGSVKIEKLIGKEYNTRDDNHNLVKANFETDKIVFNNVPGGYIKSLNDYFKKDAEEKIKYSKAVTTKEEADEYGLEIGDSISNATMEVISNNVYKDIVSLKIETSGVVANGGGFIELSTLNVNLKTGYKVSNSELLYMYNINQDEFLEKMNDIIFKKVSKDYKDIVEKSSNIEGYYLFIDNDNNLYVQLIVPFETTSSSSELVYKIN